MIHTRRDYVQNFRTNGLVFAEKSSKKKKLFAKRLQSFKDMHEKIQHSERYNL